MTKPKDHKPKRCKQCTVTFKPASGSQVFCEDCVRRGVKDGLRDRQNIYLYGVDRQMYEAMYFEQDGACAICHEREAICIDHCHETGEARGLLCLGCNTLLGFVETPGRLEAALTYKSETAR